MPCIPSVRDITILYPMGTTTMDTLRKLEFSKRKTQRQAYFTRNGPTKEKATLRVDQLSNIDPTRVEIVSDGCGLSTLASSLRQLSCCTYVRTVTTPPMRSL